jgi:hypothetical protein
MVSKEVPDVARTLTDFDREYTVSNYWPSKGIAAKTVRAMYNKTLSAERDPPNGHTNGA